MACYFDAAGLLLMRRREAEAGDFDAVKQIDKLRHDHDATCGCNGWAKAIEANPHPLRPKAMAELLREYESRRTRAETPNPAA